MNYTKKGIHEKQKSLHATSTRLLKKGLLAVLNLFLIAVLACGIIGASLGIGIFKGVIDTAPSIENVKVTPTGFSTFVYDLEGNQIAKLISQNSNRIPVTWDMIPENLAHAFVAIEDERFYEHNGIDIKGKTVAISGFGNVAWGAATKATELGAKVITISGPDGYIYDPDGVVTEEKINYMLEMRASGRNKVQDYADKFGCKFVAGDKPWGEKVDIIMPCATQNDVDLTQAKRIVANNIKYYIEVANMPTTNEALRFLMDQKNMVVAPSKAVNAGGVLVSALEMSQNSERYSWTAEEVDSKLHQIMTGIHDGSAAAAEKYGLGYNLVAGANIAGFKKVAAAMMAQGLV